MSKHPASLFYYDLPERLIAQTPAARRDESRLLVVERKSGRLEHRRFHDLAEYLAEGDTLFLNTAAVLPARLRARRSGGGKAECFLLRPAADKRAWHCLLRPGKKLPVGSLFKGEGFEGRVLKKDAEGVALVEFQIEGGGSIVEVANRIGGVPLPPYIRREANDEDGRRGEDLERYQTVYADRSRQVAVAAPTAGLHFTAPLLERLKKKGVGRADLRLHVGLGTFKPMTGDFIEEHKIHRELYEMPAAAQKALFESKGRRVAVGTTSVRSIEDFLSGHERPLPEGETFIGESELFIYPPRKFKGVDVLLTNFHQPKSTLMCLVSAFLTPGREEGISWLKEIYKEAIRLEYRFFSYGDAMLIL